MYVDTCFQISKHVQRTLPQPIQTKGFRHLTETFFNAKMSKSYKKVAFYFFRRK